MTRKKQKTLEEKIEQVKNFRPIDDTFFEVLADDIGVCQEMLRIILEDEKLIVKDVIVQSSERNLYGRSVRLDALCILGNRKKCNVEVQRSNKDHHLKRVRFNASVITVRDSQTDDKFEETIDLIVVYISEFDIFKRGRVIYHVDSVIRETQEKVDEIGLDVKMVSKEELFKTADIITLHLRVTPETKNSINKEYIGLMKPTAYLINTSRAGVLDKDALVEALQNRTIGGAAIDVFWEEPVPKDDVLLTLDNLTMTPHNAGNVVDALPKSPLLLARTIKEFWDTGKSDMVVNLRNITI